VQIETSTSLSWRILGVACLSSGRRGSSITIKEELNGSANACTSDEISGKMKGSLSILFVVIVFSKNANHVHYMLSLSFRMKT
jgi:hypothetical protein